MIFEMPYAADCPNREVQNRLALTLADWVERLNQRLAEQKKVLVTFDRAEARTVEGTVEVSRSLLKAFPANGLDDNNCLRAPVVLNGIQIDIPIAYDIPATLSLMFIQANGAFYDGLAVNPSKQEKKANRQDSVETELARSIKATLSKLMTPEHDASLSNCHKSDWVLCQPCFFPKIHGEWLPRLLFALNTFDPSLKVQETGSGFLPIFEQSSSVYLDFHTEMAALADLYLMDWAKDASDLD